MTSRRVLVTGLSTYWGGRLAQALERDPSIETVIGIDRRPPKVALARTEFVQVADHHSLIRRVVDAASIDTVVDTRLVTDSGVTSARRAHENNAIGTMNVLAACAGADSPVRKLVFRSSAHYYGAEQDDPAFFTEDMTRPHPPLTAIERDITEAEGQVRDFRARHPGTTVTVLRFADGVGPDLRTSLTKYLGLPVLPSILGFDPRLQAIHEDDIAGCLEHAVRHDLDGVFNCAADGVLVLSEIASLLGKTLLPVLPPWGTGLALGLARRGGVRIAPELENLLRFGRGLDNRRFKATGYRFASTTREAIQRLAGHQRVAAIMGAAGAREAYRYEAAVEEFLRFSPSVRTANLRPGADQGEEGAGEGAEAPPVPGSPATVRYVDLDAREVVALLPSLTAGDLRALQDHELSGPRRPEVLAAIAQLLDAGPSAG